MKNLWPASLLCSHVRAKQSLSLCNVLKPLLKRGLHMLQASDPSMARPSACRPPQEVTLQSTTTPPPQLLALQVQVQVQLLVSYLSQLHWRHVVIVTRASHMLDGLIANSA